MSLGTKIKALRQEKGLSQVELGKLAGVHSKLIGKYENEQVIPTADTLRGLAAGLGVSSDYLLFDSAPRQGTIELKDMSLYERFCEAELFDEADRDALKRILDAMIVKKKIHAAVSSRPEGNPHPWQESARKITEKIEERTRHITPRVKQRLIDEAVRSVRKGHV